MRLGRTALAVTSALLSLPLLSGSAHAQEWRAEVQAGRFHSLGAPVDTVSSSLALGIRRDGLRSALMLSAGVPVRGEDPLWGFGGFWHRAVADRGGFLAGVDLSGHGFVHRAPDAADGGSTPRRPPGLIGLIGGPDQPPGAGGAFSLYGLGGEAMPVLGYRGGRARVEVRSGVAYEHTIFGGEGSFGRTLHVSDARVVLTPRSFVSVGAEARRLDAEEAAYDYAGLTATFAHARGSAWVSAGRWLSPDTVATPWTVGAELRMTDRVMASVTGRHESLDPLYLSGPRTSWSIGLGYSISRPPRLAAPVPAAYVDGRATILLPEKNVEGRPHIAGDFNDWSPEPMTNAGGSWSYTVTVAPGVYHYAFVSAEGEWFVPDSVPGRKDDGMGGHVAVLVVH